MHQYKKRITDEEIDDLMVTALEGGITYWCSEARISSKKIEKPYEYASEVISRGGSLQLYDFEEEKWYTLNLAKLLKGLSLSNFDADNYDAGDADEVVQKSIFGEVVYG